MNAAADPLSIARGAYVTLAQLGGERRTIVERFERTLASIRHYVPEGEWAQVANTLGELRLNEERAQRVRSEVERQLIGATPPA